MFYMFRHVLGVIIRVLASVKFVSFEMVGNVGYNHLLGCRVSTVVTDQCNKFDFIN